LTGSGYIANVLIFHKHGINHNFTSRTRSRGYQWQTPVSYLTSTNSWDSPSAKYQLALAWLTVWLYNNRYGLPNRTRAANYFVVQRIRLVGHLARSFYFRFPTLDVLSFRKMQKLSCVRDVTHQLRGILRISYIDRHPICMTRCVKLTPLLDLAFQITALTVLV
jgi:hypothetical protein